MEEASVKNLKKTNISTTGTYKEKKYIAGRYN
jgi:hypothetical protein